MQILMTPCGKNSSSAGSSNPTPHLCLPSSTLLPSVSLPPLHLLAPRFHLIQLLIIYSDGEHSAHCSGSTDTGTSLLILLSLSFYSRSSQPPPLPSPLSLSLSFAVLLLMFFCRVPPDPADPTCGSSGGPNEVPPLYPISLCLFSLFFSPPHLSSGTNSSPFSLSLSLLSPPLYSSIQIWEFGDTAFEAISIVMKIREQLRPCIYSFSLFFSFIHLFLYSFVLFFFFSSFLFCCFVVFSF